MTTATTTQRQSALSSNPTDLRRNTLKKNMSITQTYFLAHKARAKLSREAAQPDHDLRLLVGHANLLDTLMVELADAEREQERWFNQSVRGASKTRAEESVEDYYSDSSDSDSDDYDSDEDVEMTNTAATAVSTKPVSIRIQPAEDMEADDLEEDYAELTLVRTHSHSPTSPPPDLIEPDSDSSEDESMPPSPPQPTLCFDDAKPVKAQTEEDEDESYYDEDYCVEPQTPTRLATAISVY